MRGSRKRRLLRKMFARTLHRVKRINRIRVKRGGFRI